MSHFSMALDSWTKLYILLHGFIHVGFEKFFSIVHIYWQMWIFINYSPHLHIHTLWLLTNERRWWCRRSGTTLANLSIVVPSHLAMPFMILIFVLIMILILSFFRWFCIIMVWWLLCTCYDFVSRLIKLEILTPYLSSFSYLDLWLIN